MDVNSSREQTGKLCIHVFQNTSFFETKSGPPSSEYQSGLMPKLPFAQAVGGGEDASRWYRTDRLK